MKRSVLTCRVFCRFLLLWALAAGSLPAAEPGDSALRRKQSHAAMEAGNYKDAYQGFRRLVLDRRDDPPLAADDLAAATGCLERLNRDDEIDVLVEDAVKTHPGNWRLLRCAAGDYWDAHHTGSIVAGKFYRYGYHRDGRWVDAEDRDRVRALQLMVQALPLALNDGNRTEVGEYLLAFAGMLRGGRHSAAAWRLQYLTELNFLPDYEDWSRGDHRDAPVDSDGRPIFYRAPKTFAAAANDGQRWRWCLETAARLDPRLRARARMALADFLRNQFDAVPAGSGEGPHDRHTAAAGAPLYGLGEDETIARLATGIRRIKLPDEFNFIKIYREIAEGDPKSYAPEDRRRAGTTLISIFTSRRQYAKVAAICRWLLRDFPGESAENRGHWQRLIDQIVGNWGRFEPSQAQPAGRPATVEYRFRNGRQVRLTAHEIRFEKLLEDVKAYLRSHPSVPPWGNAEIGDIGRRIVEKNEKQYLGRQVAQWTLGLEPREAHFDRHVTVALPFQRPGGYLVEAVMAGGNTSFVVVWIDDTVILQKPVVGKTYYFVADALIGEPIAKANVEFFGRQFIPAESKSGEPAPRQLIEMPIQEGEPAVGRIVTRQFAEYTDADGQVTCGPERQPGEVQWLVIARTPKGRFAHLGFNNVWYPQAPTSSTAKQKSSASPTGRSTVRSRRYTTSSGSAGRSTTCRIRRGLPIDSSRSRFGIPNTRRFSLQ